MGIPAAATSRTAWAVIWLLPKRQIWETSISFTCWSTSPRRLTVSTSPLLPTVTPCS